MLPLVRDTLSWKSILRQNFTRWDQLAEFLELTHEQQNQITFSPKFPLNFPLRLAKKVPKGTLDDPILQQFLPLKMETAEEAGFYQDPVGHAICRKEAKLVHKYQGRVLLTCTSACAMHCRYCYRQHFEYECQDKTFSKEIEYIRADSSIHEVILSGGDPLSLSDQTLYSLLNQLDKISHVQRLRFHTRFPIGIPERIDEGFLSLFDDLTKPLWFVIHCNHPRELDEDVLRALSHLQKRGITVLNQSVLLKNINDDIDTLKTLCEKLINHNIFPYYLHQLDRVQGAAHFEVSVEKGKELIKELACLLPGYAVPKYVREIPGDPYKAWLN